jgi:2'-5' RNA ligase
VAGGDRIRLFCALRLPEPALAAFERWQQEHLSGGRLVPRQNLHVTLAFLGHRPATDVPAVAAALAAAAGDAEPPELHPSGYRETRSVGMVVLDDLSGAAGRLADDLQGRLEELGLFRREHRPWLPHVTALRFRERPHLRPPVDGLANICPSDAAVMVSVLGPAGAQYEVLEHAVLGGR